MKKVNDEGTSIDHFLTTALSQYLNQPLHTLFQVSTSAALVQGLYQGAVRVSRLLQHGDFGLGTFVALDGEMVVLDGLCYRISPSGAVSRVPPDTLIPYAVVTQFRPEREERELAFSNFSEFAEVCDKLRSSQNVFYAFRAYGKCEFVKTRVMHPMVDGMGLAKAASVQEEFTHTEVSGTFVGFWSPAFSSVFSVPGYHFHFMSEDRSFGGHVLDCRSSSITIESCTISEMHVSLPETEAFLKADLSRCPDGDLEIAERNHIPDKSDRNLKNEVE